MKIRKAVIPAGGLGTRFLPATKTLPKELLPIVDIPIIQYIVEEAVNSGIEQVMIVTSRGKSSIMDHFDSAPELEALLERTGKYQLLEQLNRTREMADIFSVRQPEPRGLGHAVLCAKEFVADEPFVVLLGDDLVDASEPCSRQLIKVFEKHGKSVAALLRVADEEISRFGICGGHLIEPRTLDLDMMVEKPSIEQAPSHFAIVGRYVLQPSIFKYLEQISPDHNGEYQLTHAMERMMKIEGFIGHEFEGQRYDAGDKLGFLFAGISYGMKRRDIAPKLKAFMQEILG